MRGSAGTTAAGRSSSSRRGSLAAQNGELTLASSDFAATACRFICRAVELFGSSPRFRAPVF
jgi:hypothetical protein